MNLIKEKAKTNIPKRKHLNGVTQEMLKGLCFNCDHRKTCTWKENRKIYCEHFE
ncbi:hypothetical protein [Christiangramia sediminis]|uniref:Uncharacterized protein n=1 Tax=Christiangramia sediminis TaxID=2881336 RepID=A0A9X1LH85_9FLAO|nr:hypothetical protein [Christiangramia sediminis]MCB7480341.1 hypothetical protein [Christiangramia sediminis]